MLNASIAEIADFYQNIILYVKEENHSAIRLFDRMDFVSEKVEGPILHKKDRLRSQ